MTPKTPGILKYLLSFFAEIPVESASSAINPQLDIVYAAGRFKLNTKNATYSFEDKYGSFGTALYQLKSELPKLESALLLGLGLGSIPFMLLKKYKFKGEIICVDIDPVIIQLATRYFPIRPFPDNLHFVQDDALNFILSNEQKFGLLAVDLFIDRNIPKKFHEPEFLLALKRSVAPGGLLLFSRLTDNYVAERSLNMELRRIFPGANEIDTNGNLILCWYSPL